ncbi:MAG: PDC sensor domain-containing protein [Alphaproteobacteria bacterium]|nr:PDC sensor domain-containing protein [Alphaproteobacteria bacterium]
MPEATLKEATQKQREKLTALIGPVMNSLAHGARERFANRAAVEAVLTRRIVEMEYCKHIFALDPNGIQFVDNITRTGNDPSYRGRNRADRPYLQGLVGSTDFKLSEAYISRNRKRPMLTAVQVVRDASGQLIGFIGADFDLLELPATERLYRDVQTWRQVKGDPAIRGGLFAQQRVQSVLDEHLDVVLPLVCELMMERGIFHGKVHFSSNRATIWLLDDPFSYRLLDSTDLLDPAICLAYRSRPYPDCACVPQDMIPKVFEMFRELRFADETIYLRSGSLNICNGLVSLNFSCDGTHYVRADELLERGLDFWIGNK